MLGVDTILLLLSHPMWLLHPSGTTSNCHTSLTQASTSLTWRKLACIVINKISTAIYVLTMPGTVPVTTPVLPNPHTTPLVQASTIQVTGDTSYFTPEHSSASLSDSGCYCLHREAAGYCILLLVPALSLNTTEFNLCFLCLLPQNRIDLVIQAIQVNFAKSQRWRWRSLTSGC